MRFKNGFMSVKILEVGPLIRNKTQTGSKLLRPPKHTHLYYIIINLLYFTLQ